jgi:Type I phosphodiesterase / nucleotide pyrophosphatase
MVFATFPRVFRKRSFLLVSVLLLAAACTDTARPDGRPSARATQTPTPTMVEGDGLTRVACGLPRAWLVRMWRGYSPQRSGELQILPKVPNFVGAGLPHVGPWDFTERVPMVWYGPGQVEAVGEVERPVTSADIAPTQAGLVEFADFDAPDGRPMQEALVPAEQREPPRLVVVVIWDGAGRNVLDEWPTSWPNLQRLRSEGAWYEHATVGSSPTSSAQIHATIGTGAFPRKHGLVGHSLRIGRDIESPWKDGPELLVAPTFADVYDRAMGNRPLVGTAGTVPIQLGMMSHGTGREGGDRDLAVLRVPGNATTLGAEGVSWNLPQVLMPYFRYPRYANDLPALSTYIGDDLDLADGKRDGLWRGHSMTADELLGGFHTPARIPYQTRLITEMIEQEGFGADDVPDLLYVNYKLTDQIGHIYSLNSAEMKDSLEAQDAALPVLIRALNRNVGRGRWAMLITADHGSTPSPAVTGAFQISAELLHAAMQERFDPDGDDVEAIQQVKQTEVFIDRRELRQNGFTLEDVARFVMGIRQRDVPIEGLPIPAPDERVFRAAFPAEMLTSLPCLPPGLRASA